jgi:hypothetical protein
MPHYCLREHRSGEVLRQRARESHAEIPPKAIHHYPAGMSMKMEGDIEEIEPTGFIKMILMASTTWALIRIRDLIPEDNRCKAQDHAKLLS